MATAPSSLIIFFLFQVWVLKISQELTERRMLSKNTHQLLPPLPALYRTPVLTQPVYKSLSFSRAEGTGATLPVQTSSMRCRVQRQPRPSYYSQDCLLSSPKKGLPTLRDAMNYLKGGLGPVHTGRCGLQSHSGTSGSDT